MTKAGFLLKRLEAGDDERKPNGLLLAPLPLSGPSFFPESSRNDESTVFSFSISLIIVRIISIALYSFLDLVISMITVSTL